MQFPSFQKSLLVPDLAQLPVDLLPHFALLSFKRALHFVDTFLLSFLRLYGSGR